MAFHSPVPTWLILAVCVLLPLALLALSFAITRFLPRKPGYLTFGIFLLLCWASEAAIAAYLDGVGQKLTGEVLDKKEDLVFHVDGSWNRRIEAEIRYRPTEDSPPVTENLAVLPDRFDDMRQGDFVPLRRARIGGVLEFTRLEDQSASSQLLAKAGNQTFFFVLGMGLLVVLAARLIRQSGLPLLFLLSGVTLIAAWWIPAAGQLAWEQAGIRMGPFDTASGIVREISRPYSSGDPRASISHTLLAPYELVLVDMIPLGHSQRVLAIDVVDPASVAVTAGQNISVEYSPANPRFVRIPDASRAYLFRNTMVSTLLALAGLAVVVAIALLLRTQTPRPPPPSIPAYKRPQHSVRIT